ncbi:MAG: ion channel [Candidatus Neomarinimicrobiota bacterium]
MRKELRNVIRNRFFQIIFGIYTVMFLGGWGIGHFEEMREITHGVNPFWWAIVTMTTVGYGDFSPETSVGRMIAIFIMYGGILLTALLTATISSIFVAKRIREDKGLEKLDVTGHIVICGWLRNADILLDSLQSLSEDKTVQIVLINNEHEDLIASIKNKYRGLQIRPVRGDFTRETILERANIKEASTAIVLPSDSPEGGSHPDEKTIFGTLTIKTLAPGVRVVAYITERENLTHIRRANADEVILSDDFGAYMVAAHVAEPGVPQTIEALLDGRSPSRFHRADVPAEFVGKSYTELFDHFRQKHGWILVSTFSEEEHFGIGEILASDTSALDVFIERKLTEAGRSLTEKSKASVVVNPGPDYTIKKRERAVVVL